MKMVSSQRRRDFFQISCMEHEHETSQLHDALSSSVQSTRGKMAEPVKRVAIISRSQAAEVIRPSHTGATAASLGLLPYDKDLSSSATSTTRGRRRFRRSTRPPPPQLQYPTEYSLAFVPTREWPEMMIGEVAIRIKKPSSAIVPKPDATAAGDLHSSTSAADQNEHDDASSVSSMSSIDTESSDESE